MLEQKRRWLEHHGLTSEWIGRDDYRDFLVGLASQPDTGVKLFALKIDGVPIAGQLATVDPMRFQAHIGVYDPQWSFYAPGQVLTEHCMARAFVRGLDFDLRVGDEAYKRDWAPRSCDTTTWYVAASWRGLRVVARRSAVLVSWQLKSRLRRLLRRGRGT